MKLCVTRVHVWAASVTDRPGGMAAKLRALADAGANLEFVIARRAPEKPGTGVVFVTPIAGARQVRAAKAAGFLRTDSLHSVRVEGADAPGLGACLTETLAASGINLRGFSAACIGKRFVAHLGLDTAADAARAVRALKNLTK